MALCSGLDGGRVCPGGHADGGLLRSSQPKVGGDCGLATPQKVERRTAHGPQCTAHGAQNQEEQADALKSYMPIQEIGIPLRMAPAHRSID